MLEYRTEPEAATQALESALRSLLLRSTAAPPEVVRAAAAAFGGHSRDHVVATPRSGA